MMKTNISLASGDNFGTVLDLDVVGAAVLVPHLRLLGQLDAGEVSLPECLDLIFAAMNKNEIQLLVQTKRKFLGARLSEGCSTQRNFSYFASC